VIIFYVTKTKGQMGQKKVRFATKKVGGKRVVIEDVKEYNPDESQEDKVLVAVDHQLTEQRKQCKDIRRWYNKTERYLKELRVKRGMTDDITECEYLLNEMVKTLVYQLKKIEEHRSLCKRYFDRESIY
tara:strand:+ start:108 stop:494 length:387 start_codon:yes stop_codon:yes gene_type:complete